MMWVKNVQLLEYEPQRSSSRHPINRERRRCRQLEDEARDLATGAVIMSALLITALFMLLAAGV